MAHCSSNSLWSSSFLTNQRTLLVNKTKIFGYPNAVWSFDNGTDYDEVRTSIRIAHCDSSCWDLDIFFRQQIICPTKICPGTNEVIITLYGPRAGIPTTQVRAMNQKKELKSVRQKALLIRIRLRDNWMERERPMVRHKEAMPNSSIYFPRRIMRQGN